MTVALDRIRARNEAAIKAGPVLYWMQRDMRVQDNWALHYACDQATQHGREVLVLYIIPPNFPYTTERHVDFMLGGVREVAQDLATSNIPFLFRHSDPAHIINELIAMYHIGEVVTDFNPLQAVQSTTRDVATQLPVRLTEV